LLFGFGLDNLFLGLDEHLDLAYSFSN
jgi:hypothetical protein